MLCSKPSCDWVGAEGDRVARAVSIATTIRINQQSSDTNSGMLCKKASCDRVGAEGDQVVRAARIATTKRTKQQNHQQWNAL